MCKAKNEPLIASALQDFNLSDVYDFCKKVLQRYEKEFWLFGNRLLTAQKVKSMMADCSTFEQLVTVFASSPDEFIAYLDENEAAFKIEYNAVETKIRFIASCQVVINYSWSYKMFQEVYTFLSGIVTITEIATKDKDGKDVVQRQVHKPYDCNAQVQKHIQQL